MDLQDSQQTSVERLIATTRVVMVVSALLALWLDSSQPAKDAQIADTALIGYLVYALILALVAWYADVFPRYLRFITHAFDVAFFSFVVHITEGSASPFFVFFVFSLVCGMLRWLWHGVLWTALAALTTFIGISMYAAKILHDQAFELNRYIIHALYLVAVATLLGGVGAYRQRADRNIAKLAARPRVIQREARTIVHQVLAHAADLLHDPRVLMIWDEPEEPWIHLALWDLNNLHLTREPPDTFDYLVAEPLVNTSFFCPDVRAPTPRVLYASAAGLQRWHGKPLHHDLQTRFAIGSVLSMSLRGAILEGRIFFLDMQGLTPDDLVLGDIVARQVAAELDQFYLIQRQQQVAVMEERLRLARNLHDGLLQSLTGTALQLTEVQRLLEENPPAAREHLLEIQRLLADEQSDLRFLASELKSASFDAPEAGFGLAARLKAMSRQIERQWGLRVDLNLKPPELSLPTTLAYEIYFIVHEAVVNAARHAHASAVCVELGVQNQHVQITVTDNGQGFPFRGYYNLAALTYLKLGPMMLRERIASLGGDLALDSTRDGARLEILLPLAPPGGHDADTSSARG